MSPATRWVGGITALLLGGAVAVVTMMVFASRANPAQVLPAYYDRAIRFDETMEAARRSRALGWRATTVIAGGVIEIDLRDRTDAAVAGAALAVDGFQRAHPDAPLAIALFEIAPGRYRGTLGSRPGWHQLTITASRGDARYVAGTVVEATR